MKNLKSRLKNLGIGLGIAGLSLLSMKGLGQETSDTQTDISLYYFKGGISLKSFNSSGIAEYFNPIIGIRGSVGAFISGRSRIEFELELASKENKDENLTIIFLEGGAYYDLALIPKKGLVIYGGVGVKGLSATANYKYTQNSIPKSEREKTSGIGLGVRGGIEKNVGGNIFLYLEINYDDIVGKLDGEEVDLSSSGLNAGIIKYF